MIKSFFDNKELTKYSLGLSLFSYYGKEYWQIEVDINSHYTHLSKVTRQRIYKKFINAIEYYLFIQEEFLKQFLKKCCKNLLELDKDIKLVKESEDTYMFFTYKRNLVNKMSDIVEEIEEEYAVKLRMSGVFVGVDYFYCFFVDDLDFQRRVDDSSIEDVTDKFSNRIVLD